MKRHRKRPSDHVLGKCLAMSLLGMAVYVTGNLEGQAAARYAEPAPVKLWKQKPQAEKKHIASKQRAEQAYQLALAGCDDDFVCIAHLDYERKQGRL